MLESRSRPTPLENPSENTDKTGFCGPDPGVEEATQLKPAHSGHPRASSEETRADRERLRTRVGNLPARCNKNPETTMLCLGVAWEKKN
jgi:hypothetical protein